MKTIDRQSAKALSLDMMEALKAVATKHGVQFRDKGGSFTPNNVTFRIEAAVIGATGVAETKERTEYPRYCQMYGLKAEWLDQSFTSAGGESYTIVGLNTRKHKNPILCKRVSDGKIYVFSAEAVKMYMAMAAAPKA